MLLVLIILLLYCRLSPNVIHCSPWFFHLCFEQVTTNIWNYFSVHYWCTALLAEPQEVTTSTLSFNFTASHPVVEATAPLVIQFIVDEGNQCVFDSFVSPTTLVWIVGGTQFYSVAMLHLQSYGSCCSTEALVSINSRYNSWCTQETVLLSNELPRKHNMSAVHKCTITIILPLKWILRNFYFNSYTSGIIGRGIAAAQGVILLLSLN